MNCTIIIIFLFYKSSLEEKCAFSEENGRAT